MARADGVQTINSRITNRRRQLRRTVVATAAVVAGLAVSLSIDRPILDLLPVLHHSVNLPTNDWIGLGRLMGFAPTWIVVGVALLLVDRAEAIVGEPSYLKYRRLTLLLSSAALGGLAAEALKIVARRERPAADATEHVFRSITDRPFYGGGLGLPSGHAATAAAALYCMWRFFPSAAPVWITLMIGCGLSRLADGSHFVSDVYCGAIVGVVTASLIWVNDDRKRGRRTSDPSLLHIAA